ncbi:MAG: hypothetical protein IKU25_02140 [Clostridia bacterium]|nr:hypothetical protein [Clostridia bacterium]
MKNSFPLWQLIGFGATSLGGTLLHFLYEWTGENAFAALISGVNESTWEHMKLLFFPTFIFALIQSRYFKDLGNFWCIKFVGIVTGLILIPVIFYTYNGAFGKSPDWLNISIFFICAAIVYITETRLYNKNFSCKRPTAAFIGICLIGVAFIVFTFHTPQIPLFQDPITRLYGI